MILQYIKSLSWLIIRRFHHLGNNAFCKINSCPIVSSNFGYITLILNDGSEAKLFVLISQTLTCLRQVCIYSRCFYESHFKALGRWICFMACSNARDNIRWVSGNTNTTQMNGLRHTCFNIDMNNVHVKSPSFLQITRQSPETATVLMTCYTARCSLFQRRIRNDRSVHTS